MIASRKKKPDYTLALVVFILVVLGLIMISSASVVKSYQITEGRSNYFFLWQQLIALGVGIFVWIFFQSIDYRVWKKWARPIFITSLILLFLVYVPWISKSTAGVSRWIGIGSFVFQPSEFAKLALVIFLGWYFSKYRDKLTNLWLGFLPFITILSFVVLLIAREPDMSTALTVGLIGLGMFFVAGGNLLHLAAILPVLGAASWLLIKKAPYRMARIKAFLNPESDILGVSYHINQALIAIGSGGWWGLGFGNSRQKFNFLPEAHTDSIFAIICEELGFLRAAFVIILFVIFALRGMKIASEAPDDFGKYLASGIVLWFVLQAFVNLAALLNFLPFTGIPLPFLSYGGSSLVISLASVGILLNISKQAK